MKKFFAFLLVLAMMFSLCGVAMAAVGAPDINGAGAVTGGTTGDVNVAVDTDAATVYYVVVSWAGLTTFTYDFDKEYDAENHTLKDGSDAKWNNTTGTVTVTNHSNTSIKVSGKFRTTAEDYLVVNGVRATLSGHTESTLPSAVGKALNAADLIKTITVTVSGTPDTDTGFKIDTIDLTIKT